MEPVERARKGEEVVAVHRVREIADQHVHPDFVPSLSEPGRIEVSDDRRRVHEVAVVEVVIVVVCAAKVQTGIAVSGHGHHTSPSCLI